MTREEAIEVIEQDIPCEHDRDLIEALDMAISSLSDNKGDLISRQAVLDELEKWDWQELYLPIHFNQILDDVPSVENKGEWIPLTTRPMTEEEITDWRNCAECGEIFDCPLPDDGQQVLISVGGNVDVDIFVIDEGCYFERVDIGDVDAWQPLPEPYKAESEANKTHQEHCKGDTTWESSTRALKR